MEHSGFREYVLQIIVHLFHETATLLEEAQVVLFILNQCFIALLCDKLDWKGPLEVQPHSEQNQFQRLH